LLIGISITGSGMLILAIAFSIGYDKSIGIFVFACSLILGGYSVGFGPVVWLLQSEMFPITIRGRAVAISVIARNISEFIVNFSFLPLISSIGNAGAFFFYFAMCICAFVFVSVFIVETMNSEPEEILKYFDKNILVSRRKAKANFVRVPSMDISGKDDC
jgi:SP family galactose:H+ symporter-like MFS transporter